MESNPTNTVRGLSSSHALRSMLAKPTIMFAWFPAPSLIDEGSAWKARWARLSPSMARRGLKSTPILAV